MNYIIVLVVGDWSDDGHGRTSTSSYISTLSAEDVQTAFNLGVEKLGINLQYLCRDFEDNNIFVNDFEIYTRAGFTGERPEEHYRNPSNLYMDTDVYKELWLFTAQIGNPLLETKEIEGPELHIGGYGLFHM